MTKIQFHVLYREFLFRMVDLELLAPQGDINRLLGQFAALLILLGSFLSLAALGLGSSRMPRSALLIDAWGLEHILIATTMLVVGLFAVLSWDSTFPDRRDILVLAPLPVRARTLFLAKVAATATALGLTILTLNGCAGLILPFALTPAGGGILDMILSLDFLQSFAAYWISMISAGAFVFCCVLGIQGIAAQVLPRRQFLRFSAFLQLAAFCLLVCVYFLEPSLANPKALTAPGNQRLLAWLPSFWFLGLFQELNGSMHPAMAPLARRAWLGMTVVGCGTSVAYALSYFRTLRRIVEEPDIMPGSHGPHWLPSFGNSLETAIAQFAIRTLVRSRQHRVMLAFYLGLGCAIVIFMLKGGVAGGEHFAGQANARLLFSSFVIMCVWIVGTRVVFSMPLALTANWIFRVTEVRPTREYMAAIRRSLFVLAVVPVWLGCAVLFLSIWPWRPAAGHLVIIGLWGVILAYLGLHGFQKIPFTCSYLPGKSLFHIGFLAAVGLIFLIGKAVDFERGALDDSFSYAKAVVVLLVIAVLARWRTIELSRSAYAIVQFEELVPPAILTLGL
jgi:hypothetical protein